MRRPPYLAGYIHSFTNSPNYVSKSKDGVPSFSRWFHGKISRKDAEELLQPREDGLFLVRESSNFPGDYTLCVCFQGKVEHYHILYQKNSLTVDEEAYFKNLDELVEVLYYEYKSGKVRSH